MAEVDRQADLERIRAEERRVRDLDKAARDRQKQLDAYAARHRLEDGRER